MKRSLVCMAGVLFLLAARTANAGLFTSTQLCWAGSGTYTTAFDSCTYTGSAYVDTPNPGGGNDQIFDASATAVADPTEWKVAVNLILTDADSLIR